jgi:hypothetical protein
MKAILPLACSGEFVFVDVARIAVCACAPGRSTSKNADIQVCAFVTSAEYQLQFGSLVTRSNADCGQ